MSHKLYDDLASWWPLMSAPADYEEEAEFFGNTLLEAGDQPARTLLEIGSGGGNNASHLKRRFDLTLVEPSAGMREVSRALNPECEHLPGDMRTVRLGRTFDRVFLHDAVSYMTTEADLRKAIESVFVHCRPGGAALIAPDHFRETLEDSTDHGGEDAPDGRGLRYLSWSWDPDPNDTACCTDYAYLLREADGSMRVELDRHVEGVFPRGTWLALMAECGFETKVVPFDHSELEPGTYQLLVGVRPRR
jgi:SAM-dependent methyltransferase